MNQQRVLLFARVLFASLAEASAVGNLTFENLDERAVVPGFLDETLCPGPHGLDGKLDIPPCGHHDNREVRVLGAQAARAVRAPPHPRSYLLNS